MNGAQTSNSLQSSSGETGQVKSTGAVAAAIIPNDTNALNSIKQDSVN